MKKHPTLDESVKKSRIDNIVCFRQVHLRNRFHVFFRTTHFFISIGGTWGSMNKPITVRKISEGDFIYYKTFEVEEVEYSWLKKLIKKFHTHKIVIE